MCTVLRLLTDGDPVAGSGAGSNCGEGEGGGRIAGVLAYWRESGADLLDMEFVQFHPAGMVWPPR